jgi:hypothetical protein
MIKKFFNYNLLEFAKNNYPQISLILSLFLIAASTFLSREQYRQQNNEKIKTVMLLNIIGVVSLSLFIIHYFVKL